MGDPKKQRPKFQTPSHPWQKERIEEEKKIMREYALKNKTEIYRLNSILRKFASQAKNLVAKKTEQAEKEKKQLMERLVRLGILEGNAHMDDVLALTLKNILERRLQSLVFRKGMSKTMNQARQFITHRHITLNGKKLTSPNHLVPKELENTIQYSPSSNLKDEMHPERIQPKIVTKEEKTGKVEKTGKKDDKGTKKVVKKDNKQNKKQDKKEVKKEIKKEEPKKEVKKEEVKKEDSKKEEPKKEENKEK